MKNPFQGKTIHSNTLILPQPVKKQIKIGIFLPLIGLDMHKKCGYSKDSVDKNKHQESVQPLLEIECCCSQQEIDLIFDKSFEIIP